MRLSQSFKAVVGSASCAADNGDALVVGGSAVARQAASIGRIGRRATEAPTLAMNQKRMPVGKTPPIAASQARLLLRQANSRPQRLSADGRATKSKAPMGSSDGRI